MLAIGDHQQVSASALRAGGDYAFDRGLWRAIAFTSGECHSAEFRLTALSTHLPFAVDKENNELDRQQARAGFERPAFVCHDYSQLAPAGPVGAANGDCVPRPSV